MIESKERDDVINSILRGQSPLSTYLKDHRTGDDTTKPMQSRIKGNFRKKLTIAVVDKSAKDVEITDDLVISLDEGDVIGLINENYNKLKDKGIIRGVGEHDST